MASVALIAPMSAAQSQRSTEARGRLGSAYPGVVVHYPQRDAEGLPSSWAGAEQVLGVPMPASGAGGSEPAESPEEALTDWLDAFGGVFQGDGQIEALDLVVTSALPMRDGRVALRFEQRIADPREPEHHLSAVGVHGRALAAEHDFGWSLVYVATAPLDVPSGGVATPLIGAEAAKAIAATASRAAQSGKDFGWGQPALRIVASGDQERPREARAVWAVGGYAPGEGGGIVEVVVDGQTGAIRDERAITPAGFAQTPSVSGTVTGEVLQGLTPWESVETLLPCSSFSTAIEALPRFRVELLDAPGGNVVATTRTNASGYYAFNGQTITSNSRVRFVPEHEFFVMAEGLSIFEQVDPLIVYAIWEDLSGFEKPVGSTGATVNFLYADDRSSSTPGSEMDVADASVYQTLDEARTFYLSRLPSNTNAYYPGLHDSNLRVFSTDTVIGGRPLNYDTAGYWYDGYAVPGGSPEYIGQPAVMFSHEGDCVRCPTRSGPDTANFGFSTIVSHEYGHYLGEFLVGIPYPNNAGFHEGYADLLALLQHDPSDGVIGKAGFGCSTEGRQDIRDWEALEASWTPTRNCSYTVGAADYERAQRLVLIWRYLRDSLDIGVTRQLFVDWSLLAAPEPTPRSCGVGASVDLSAHDATYYEVLVADDDNNNLSDGTPHDAEICAAFTAYGLPAGEEIDCPEASSGERCRVDFDRDGAFSVHDVMMFNELFAEGSSLVDLNGDGRIDLFDHLELTRMALMCP
jgi:hypothetical protein